MLSRCGLGTDGGGPRSGTLTNPPVPCSLCTHPISLKLRHALNDVMGARGPSLRSKYYGPPVRDLLPFLPHPCARNVPMLTALKSRWCWVVHLHVLKVKGPTAP